MPTVSDLAHIRELFKLQSTNHNTWNWGDKRGFYSLNLSRIFFCFKNQKVKLKKIYTILYYTIGISFALTDSPNFSLQIG